MRITLEAPEGFAAAQGRTGGAGGPDCSPLVVCGLNTYENRMTVMHLSSNPNPNPNPNPLTPSNPSPDPNQVMHFTVSLSASAEAAELTLRGKQVAPGQL